MKYKLQEKVECSLGLGGNQHLKGFKGEISEIDNYDNTEIYLVYAENDGPTYSKNFKAWKTWDKTWFKAIELSYQQAEIDPVTDEL